MPKELLQEVPTFKKKDADKVKLQLINPIFIERLGEELTKVDANGDIEDVRLDLFEPGILVETAKVLGFGAKKYSADNWKLNKDKQRIIGALLRHINDYQQGNLYDEEEQNNLGCCLCQLMFLFWMEQSEQGEVNVPSN